MAIRRKKADYSKTHPVSPTLIVTSFKGGAFKTSTAIAVMQRLAWAGLNVLGITTDPQQDAAEILVGHSVKAEEPYVPDGYGKKLTILSAGQKTLWNVLYETKGFEGFDVIVVDTPPDDRFGIFPNVTFAITVPPDRGVVNAGKLLNRKNATSSAILIPVQGTKKTDIKNLINGNKNTRLSAGRITNCNHVRRGLAERKSLWQIPRRPTVYRQLDVAEELCEVMWKSVKNGPIPEPPDAETAAYNPFD